MVELSNEIIDVIKKIKDVLEGSPFDINRFEVGETGAEGEVIHLDIRRHKKEDEE